MESEDLPEGTVYACKDIGVASTTAVWIRNDGNVFTARMGFALMGCTNMSEEEFEACGHNPFHPNFNDNYAEGVGATEQEAIDKMKASMRETADSLWLI